LAGAEVEPADLAPGPVASAELVVPGVGEPADQVAAEDVPARLRMGGVSGIPARAAGVAALVRAEPVVQAEEVLEQEVELVAAVV
jgi:hypothetical protein